MQTSSSSPLACESNGHIDETYLNDCMAAAVFTLELFSMCVYVEHTAFLRHTERPTARERCTVYAARRKPTTKTAIRSYVTVDWSITKSHSHSHHTKCLAASETSDLNNWCNEAAELKVIQYHFEHHKITFHWSNGLALGGVQVTGNERAFVRYACVHRTMCRIRCAGHGYIFALSAISSESAGCRIVFPFSLHFRRWPHP